MSFCYYITLTVATISIAIFNLSVSSEGKSLQCFSLKEMNKDTYDQYLLSPASNLTAQNITNVPPTTMKVVDNVNVYTVPQVSSNSYKTLADVIAIIYLIIMFLALILTVVLFWLSDLVPDDFLNMGWVKRGAAITTKIFPPIIVLMHWLILILVIVYWIILGTESCKVSEPATSSVFDFNVLKYHQLCVNLQIVNSIVAFVLHFGFAILKDMLYIEPFMYSPQVGKTGKCRDITLRVLGP